MGKSPDSIWGDAKVCLGGKFCSAVGKRSGKNESGSGVKWEPLFQISQHGTSVEDPLPLFRGSATTVPIREENSADHS